jgi:lysine 2,3-aminomutase
MDFVDIVYDIRFSNANETSQVTLAELGHATIDFLEHYGHASLLGKPFCGIIGDGSGEIRFQRLLKASGYANDANGFFLALIRQLEAAGSASADPMTINAIELPYLLLVAILEKMIAGHRFVTIKNVNRLETLTNTTVDESARNDLQKVIDTYPVRLSMHVIRQMRVSQAVAYQYMPFVEELDPIGHTNTWIGQFHQGLLEQMYQNRVIYLLNMSCPVYCRFCFRKHKDSRQQPNPTTADVQKAVEHVKNSPGIKEVVLTGGDPFLSRANIAGTIDGLMQIPHVQTLRLATRSIAYYPHLFFENQKFWLNYLKRKSLALQENGKRMEVATHFIHPDEISPESLDIITQLVKSGIAVYVQTPFLKDCNDKGPELTRLFHLLRGAGAELHYIYIPCSPIQGNSIYWTPISKGLEAARYLRAHLSDRIIPRICTATAIGKIDWQSSGWAVEPDKENANFIWIRTPYTPDYFKAFAPIANELDIVRINAEGVIEAKYMAKIGDLALFYGARPYTRLNENKTDQTALTQLQSDVQNDQRMSGSIVETGSIHLHRKHLTRVEVDISASDAEWAYVASDDRITDVVIASRNDALESLYAIERMIIRLRNMHHVNAVRLRSLYFNYRPESYTPAAINKLGELNRLSVVNPLRLEIETQFLHADEIRPTHRRLTRELRNLGITVYTNTPLLTNINATAADIHRLAYGLRKSGIEFHHLYVAGLPIQNTWNQHQPVDLNDVIDIAGRVRKDGSGREIPRYIIATRLGEVDYGLTSELKGDTRQVKIKLWPYDLSYYQGMQAGFTWPQDVEPDHDGRPIVPVAGVKQTGLFPIC